MQIIAGKENQIVLRFDPGEEVIESFSSFLKEKDIRAASVSGVGSAREIEISWYNLKTKEYERKTITEDLEVLSLMGSVARLDGDPAIHIHGTFGRRDLSTLGGHVHRVVVLATVEIILSVLQNVEMRRAKDEETGLNLLQ